MSLYHLSLALCMNTALPDTYQPVLHLSHEKIEQRLHEAIEFSELNRISYETRARVIMLVLQDWLLLKKEFPDWMSRINHLSDEIPVVQILGSTEEAQKQGYQCFPEYPEIVVLLWKELTIISKAVPRRV